MARLMAVADGNNTDASTWALINSTSFLESESGNTALTTSYVASSASAPGAITIDGIAVRIASRAASPSGTMSVELYNSTGGASVAGTEVTINVSDLPLCTTTDLAGGWAFFKFAAPVLLLAATNYQVRAKTSSTAQVNLYRDGTANNWSRILRTTTTQAPVAGDDRFIMGEWTGAGSQTTRTVTLDGTVTVDYGSGSTSVVTPALSISKGGEVKVGTSASTAYIHKISGNTVVYSGGVLRLADTTTRMPTTSSLVWTCDCAANVDFGIDVRNGGAFYGGGAEKTRWTLLTGDEEAAQTVIGVVATTGWQAGDELVFAPTGTTTSQRETKTVSTVDSAVQVTLTSGLANAHTGTGDVVGEVGNLTSNVRILGISASVGTFITFRAGSIGNLDNIAVRYFGSATANKRGVDIQHTNTSSGSVTLNKCAFADYSNVGGFVGNSIGAGANYYINGNVLLGSASATLNAAGGSSGTPMFEVKDNLLVGTGSLVGISMGLLTGDTGVFSGNVCAGYSNGVAFILSGNGTSKASNCKVHSNSTGFFISTIATKHLIGCTCARNGLGMGICGTESRIEGCNFWGNTTYGANVTNNAICDSPVFTNCSFRGPSQAFGFGITQNEWAVGVYRFNNCSFGETDAHGTADVQIAARQNGVILFNNCTFASPTEFVAGTETWMNEFGYVGLQRIDGTAGNHKTFVRQGIATSDTTIFNTASPSLRLEPKSATIEAATKLFPFRVPVNSGQTCTPTVQVRESVAGDGTDYNGNRVKLYVAANYNLGITADTLLDTATASSVGAWEALTGTTAAATDDGVLEFYLTCDGTTGWINIDDFTATVA